MTSLVEAVVDLLESSGWRRVSAAGHLKIDAPLLECEFGVALVASAPRMERVSSEWQRWQAELAASREIEAVGAMKDLYLLVVLPKLESGDEAQVEMIAADTNVCRKMFIVQGDRPREEVVDDLALLGVAPSPQGHPGSHSPDAALLRVGLSAEVLEDLSLRSPPAIANSVLEGRYPAGEANEDNDSPS